jgi:Domain of unknown function (DUF3463)
VHGCHVRPADWPEYGRGRDPRCAGCMAHCGDEPAAVLAMTGSLRESPPAPAGAWDGAAIKEANDGVPVRV